MRRITKNRIATRNITTIIGVTMENEMAQEDPGATLRYEMGMVWLEEDDCYLVHLPDFSEQPYRIHGDSCEEAARDGQEMLHFC